MCTQSFTPASRTDWLPSGIPARDSLSQARDSSQVPVVYTRRKFVRKTLVSFKVSFLLITLVMVSIGVIVLGQWALPMVLNRFDITSGITIYAIAGSVCNSASARLCCVEAAPGLNPSASW